MTYNAAVDLLGRNAIVGRAERAYLVTADRTHTYGEVIARTDELAAGLVGMGLAPGDRVILMTQDGAEFVQTFWAALRAGLVAVPISVSLSPAELSFIAQDSGAKAIVFDASTEERVRSAQLSSMMRIATHATELEGAVAWAGVSGDIARVRSLTTTRATPAFWLYTSGTTGKPKAVVHTHAGIGAAPRGLAGEVLHMAPSDRILSVSRMFFAYGLGASVYLPAAWGATVIVNDAPAVPLMVQELLEAHEPTLFFGVASFFSAYVRLPEAKLPASVRAIVSAGEALSSEVFHGFKLRFGLPLLDGLGCSEAMHHVTSNRLDDVVPGSAGRALPGYAIEVRGSEGAPCAEGESGELWVRGPTLLSEYWNRPELTARNLVDGWLRTGDLARITEGRLYHEGRVDDLMKLGGIWVAPREIEEILCEHPEVEGAAVVMATHEGGMSLLKAFVCSRRKDPQLHRELTAACAARLATFKVPRVFQTVDELPRTATGKLKRFSLRETT